MARESSLQETLNDGIEHYLENINTAITAIVVRVDLVNQQVDVQPSLKIKMFDGSMDVERPVIVNVPLQFPSSKTSAFTFPVSVGDSILLVFSQRGLDSWKKGNGYPTSTTDFRMFDYRDAIAIPGIAPVANSVNNPQKRLWTHDSQDTVLVHNIGQSTETEIRLPLSGGVLINTGQDVVANCQNATVNANASINLNTQNLVVDAANTTWIGNINHTGNYMQVGTYILDGININLHKHIGVTSGTQVSGVMV